MQDLWRTEGLAYENKLFYPDFAIEKGKAVFVSGPSGSGKSTLLKMLNLTLSPSAGRIYYKEEDIAEKDGVALRRQVILAGQAVYLFRGSIAENFQEYHRYHESVCPTEKEMGDYLQLCCTDFTPQDSCNTLSGGEKQRVFLAIALSLSPEVLLLDEPTAALDGALAEAVIKNILAYCQEGEITPIIISHDTALRDAFAQRILWIGGGTQ